MSKTIGIDLGTTNSCVAVMEGDNPKGDDKAGIESKSKALSEASAEMAERLYAQQGAQQGPQGGSGESTDAAGARTADDDVVDAEFEDVSKDK